MARAYTLSPGRRAFNWLMTRGRRRRVAPASVYLLTVEGRISKAPRSTPVTLVEEGDGRRWLVAPYGTTSWVKNARAAGEVTLSRGRHRERAKVVEVRPEDAAPVLRTYLGKHPVVRPFSM